MTLLAVGLNHKTAPVDVRERLTFGPDIIVAALRHAIEQEGLSEAVILSTCNRTEIYCVSNKHGRNDICRWMSHFHKLDPAVVNPALYAHKDQQAIEHLLSVSSGLDSLILGEPQILGQVKAAYQTANQAGTTGKLLERLFQHTFSAAKQVRTDTAIGSSPVSVAFAAVSLAKQIFSDTSNQTALLIGAGETIELTARHLVQQGIGKIIVANRTFEKAHELASQFDGFAIALTELSAHLAKADIIISSTASPVPVLGKGMVESALKQRKHRPVFMVDIAVPRDIEPEIAELDDVYLYTVDDLQEVIQDNLRSRQEAAEQAREIIEHQTHEFMAWMKSLDAVDLIQNYRNQAAQTRDEVLQRAMRMLENGKSAEEAMIFLANTLTNKLLHVPSSQLREASSNGDTGILDAASTLFQLGKTENSK